jgi:hypothetical protein
MKRFSRFTAILASWLAILQFSTMKEPMGVTLPAKITTKEREKKDGGKGRQQR